MDQKELKKRLKDPKISKALDKKKSKSIIKEAIKQRKKFKFPEDSINLVMTMEELSECSQELSKFVRGKGDKQHLTEEIADVLISLDYVNEVVGIDSKEIEKMKAVKLKRQDERNKAKKGGKKNV